MNKVKTTTQSLQIQEIIDELEEYISYMSFSHSNNGHWLMSCDDIRSECLHTIFTVCTKYESKPISDLIPLCKTSIRNRISSLKRKAYSKHRKDELYAPSFDDEELDLQVEDRNLLPDEEYDQLEMMAHLTKVLTVHENQLLAMLCGYGQYTFQQKYKIGYIEDMLNSNETISRIIVYSDEYISEVLQMSIEEVILLKQSLKEKLNRVFVR